MSAKINQYFYPYIGQVKDLPVYLAGIGGTEFQEHISRPEGYCWHQILFSAEGGGTLEFDDMSVKIPDRCFFFSCLHIIPTNIILMIRDGTCVG
ncbi:MAG: hypothetical protein L6V87_08555 [Ruminococcus sp.]|nr:MAG: hypothetical protein L6V87_08555 [Ruminococcus sp.]